MNFCQENYNPDKEVPISNGLLQGKQPLEDEYDPDFDSEVQNFLAELEEGVFPKKSDPTAADGKKLEDELATSKVEQYEDYYDDFSDEDESQDPPAWYDKQVSVKFTYQINYFPKNEFELRTTFSDKK